jgi:hypothetical protein
MQIGSRFGLSVLISHRYRIMLIFRHINFPAIDAVYVRLDWLRQIAFVVPIQVNDIAARHSDSEAAFFGDWDRRERKVQGYSITAIFVWI